MGHTLLFLLIELVAVAATAICGFWWYHRPGTFWKRATALSLAGVIVASGVTLWTGYRTPISLSPELAVKLRAKLETRFELVGEYVGQNYPGARLLLVVDDSPILDRRGKLARDSFLKGLAGRAELVAAVISPRVLAISAETGGQSPGPDGVVDAEARKLAAFYDRQLDTHPQVSVVVDGSGLLMGFPPTLTSRFNGPDTFPHNIEAVSDITQSFGARLRTGWIQAICITVPQPVLDSVTGEVTAAEDVCFVTLDNLAEVEKLCLDGAIDPRQAASRKPSSAASEAPRSAGAKSAPTPILAEED